MLYLLNVQPSRLVVVYPEDDPEKHEMKWYERKINKYLDKDGIAPFNPWKHGNQSVKVKTIKVFMVSQPAPSPCLKGTYFLPEV